MNHQSVGADNYESYFGERRKQEPADEFETLTVNHLFGQIYGRANDLEMRGRLNFRDRALINVAMLATLGRDPELKQHLGAADHQGFSRDHLVEIMIHVAHYAGWPAGHNGLKVVAQYFKEKEQKAKEL
jgi:4-carboxymuconolactone decarboxylase